jgi:hypothetical protein
MSDTSTAALPPVPSATAAAYAKLSPEGATLAHQQLTKAGYDTSKLSVGVVTAPAVPVPAVAPAAPAPNAERLAQWRSLQAGWSGDPAVVIREAAKVGIDLTHTPEMDAAASVVAAQQRVEAALSAPASAADYKIQWSNARELDATALKSQDTEYRAAFHAANYPASLIQPLADALIATAQQYVSKLDPKYATEADVEREGVAMKLHALEEGARVRALNNPDTQRLAELARDALPAAFKAKLEASYSMTSANAYAALAGIGRAIEQRKK